MTLATSCGPSVSRTGYEPKSAVRSSCPVVIHNATEFPASAVEMVGEISVGEAGFSTDCSEPEVIEILRREACEAGADIVRIDQESRPDLWSTCYRVDARLLRLKDRSMLSRLQDDPGYTRERMEQWKQADDEGESVLIWTSVVAGVVGGIVAVIIVSSNK